MSLAVVLSRGLAGLDAPLVTVEVHAGGGLPGINLVGLPEAEVRPVPVFPAAGRVTGITTPNRPIRPNGCGCVVESPIHPRIGT